MGILDGLRHYFGQQAGDIIPQEAPVRGPDMSMGADEYGGAPGGALPEPEAGEVRGPPTSFLDRLGKPDARGLTFGDKLFATGALLKGDSGGAATYLHNQRAAADVVSERTRKRDMARRHLEALRNNFKNGELNAEGYFRDLPDDDEDPDSAIDVLSKLSPQTSFANAGGGGGYAVTKRPFGGQMSVKQLVAPPDRKLPFGMKYDEDGNEVEDPVAIRVKEALAAAQRRGAPPAAPRPRAGPKPGPMTHLTREQLIAIAKGG